MNSESALQSVFLIGSLAFGILILWSIWLISLYKTLIKRERELKKDEHQTLNKAFKDSEKVLEGTIEKSEEFLKENEHLVAQIKSELRSTISDMLKDNLAALQTNSKEALQSSEQFFTDSQHIYTNQLKAILEEVGAQMRRQSQESRSEFDKKLMEEYQRAVSEVEQYKKSQLAQIDAEVGKRVAELVKRVLPKALSEEDHTALILEALEQAKKDGFVK